MLRICLPTVGAIILFVVAPSLLLVGGAFVSICMAILMLPHVVSKSRFSLAVYPLGLVLLAAASFFLPARNVLASWPSIWSVVALFGFACVALSGVDMLGFVTASTPAAPATPDATPLPGQRDLSAERTASPAPLRPLAIYE